MVLLQSLILMISIASILWLISLWKEDASIVDPVWSLFFFVAVNFFNYQLSAEVGGTRILILSYLVTIWSLRLSIYLFWRNWGQGEDYRYQAMRKQAGGNSFWWKSFFRVFMLQAILAWIISSTLFASYLGEHSWNWLDYLACGVWLIGFIFEAGGDWQLARFKSNSENKGKLLTTGFWKYTRHPNYFGDACCWWAYALFGLAAGVWWAPFGALLMTYLLLKISGVAMLERAMVKKVGYGNYQEETPAFFPKLF